MMQSFLFALWFFLPAGLANAAPVFASKIPNSDKLALPLDLGKHFRGKRIFGDHKTLRGLLAGIVAAEVTITLQRFAYAHTTFIKDLSPHVNYAQINTLLLGLLFALGALGFDSIKSFFKRQIGVKPGSTWFPFDQIDYIVGGLLLSALVVNLPHSNYYWIGVIWFLLHPISTVVAWTVGLKDSPI